MSVETAKVEPYDPGICLRMTKEQASQLVIGESVSATVKGTVKGVRECYDDKQMYDVDLKKASVTSAHTVNSADKAYKKLVQK